MWKSPASAPSPRRDVLEDQEDRVFDVKAVEG
jgi:hypothetical protein